MKWVLYILAGLGGLLVLTVVTSARPRQPRSDGRFETTVEIAKPAPVVFAWISEAAATEVVGRLAHRRPAT